MPGNGHRGGNGSSPRALVALGTRTHPAGMIVVTEAAAAAIRAAFEQRGELSAAVELRRLFAGVTDTAQARVRPAAGNQGIKLQYLSANP